MANGINKVILVGHLGSDPEIRNMESGNMLAKVNLATTESYKNRNGEKVDETEWHSVQFWGKLAEIVEKYLRKGNMIYVEGRIKTSKVESDGNTKYFTNIVATNMTMLGGKKNEGESQEVQDVDTPQDDDLPF